MEKDMMVQCNFGGGLEQADKYAFVQENLIEQIDMFLIKMDKDKKMDKEFIDEKEIDYTYIKMLKASLIKNQDEVDFMKDLDR